MTAFRSLTLAIKAAVLNLFSIAAAYGVVVAVFQFGWRPEPARRQRERARRGLRAHDHVRHRVRLVDGLRGLLAVPGERSLGHTRHHHQAVAVGLATTGRVISCATLVMIAVFISFVTSTNVVIKQLAVGLAASVLIDATIVRLLLVPSVMYLLGHASWWLPRWLGRALPHINVEGVPEPPADTGPPPAAAPFSTGLTLPHATGPGLLSEHPR